MSGQVTMDWSTEPILSAVDGYQGTIIDVDRSLSVGPDAFARGWKHLIRRLDDEGLTPGDRVVMALGNSPLFPAALTAILASESSPLLVHAETPPAEMLRIARRYGARFVLSDGHSVSAMVEIADRVRSLGGEPWIDVLWADLESGIRGCRHGDPLPAAPLHPTSGTTGEPKVAARPGPCAMAEAQHYVETLAIDESGMLLAAAPMSHAYAYGMCTMVPLLTGASLVTMRRFSPKLVLRALSEYPITILPAVPVMLDLLLFGAGDRLRHGPSCVLSAGSLLQPRTAVEFHKASGRWVQPLYGTTETGGIAIGAAAPPSQAGTIGPPMRSVEVAIRTSDGDGLGNGLGRIHVQSSSMMAGYLSDQGLDPSSIVDGWFRTGDLGWIDPGGRICLADRETDMINVFGMKVVPSEVEEVIRELEGVVEVKVYAGRHRSGSQFVKAAVVGSPGLDSASIRAHCERHLVYYKRPESILLVDALPKTPSGKIVRQQLP